MGPAAAGASPCPYLSSLAAYSKLESYILSFEGGYDVPWTSQFENKKYLTFVLLICYNYLLGCIMGDHVKNRNTWFTGGSPLLLAYFQVVKGFDKVSVECNLNGS